MNDAPEIKFPYVPEEKWQLKHEATPELRERALEMALRTHDSQHSHANSVIWTAGRYLDYILKGDK